MFGLSEKTLASIRQVLADHPAVEQAILYGSRALGRQKPGSDIDLTLIGARLDGQALASIANQLEESDIPYQVDLSLLADIDNPELLKHIRRVGQALYLR